MVSNGCSKDEKDVRRKGKRRRRGINSKCVERMRERML